MKNLFTILTVLIFAIGSYAQTAKVEGDLDSFKKSLSEKVVEFTMPEKTTAEEVSKSAQYYTDYFTVDYKEGAQLVTIRLVDQDEMARRVITRFLLSTGVRTVEFAGKDYTIMEFYNDFLKEL